MIIKAPSIHFASLVIAILLIVQVSPAFENGLAGATRRRGQETASQAGAFWNKARLSPGKGEGESARLHLQESMNSSVPESEPEKAALAALRMGDRSKQARRYQDALNYYRQALNVKPLPAAFRAKALNAIALIYAELHLYDLAARYFKAVHAINDPAAQMIALTGLADVYYRQGATQKALSYITLAFQLSQERHVDVDPALLYLTGRVRQEQGEVEVARGAFDQAMAAYVKLGDSAGQVRVSCALSSLCLLVSREPAALEHAEHAVALAQGQKECAVTEDDNVNVRELQRHAFLARARAERALGEKERAVNSYYWARHHMEGLWWSVYIATEASAVAFREEAQSTYRENVDLLMEQGQFKKAYELADKAKAGVALNLITARRGRLPAANSRQEASLRELSRTIARLRLQLFAPNLAQRRQSKLQKEVEEAESRMQEIQLQIEMEHTKERLVWSQLSSVEKLQKQMARDQIALAEFSLGEKRSFVWLFTPGGVYFEFLPARQEIEKSVRAYLGLLASPPNPLSPEKDILKVREQGETLFTRLFGDLSRHIIPGQRLVIVPDGLLHYLPFEALIRDGRYLVEDNEISYNSSASMLNLWQDSGRRVDSDRRELLAVGDPIFQPKATAGLKQANRLAPLPRTRDEVEYITSLFPPGARKVLLGAEATERAFKGESLRRYRRLHFATHSLIDEQSASRSAVVLSPDDDALEDGLLEVGEVSGLDLDCDLVVLSACQTGRGRLFSGEGIVGLSRAFLYAGARSVIMSLWNVSDLSTGQLMKDFYRNLTSGLSNAAALREAKLRMVGGGKQTRHPYYWSCFVMVGKP